MATYLTNPVVVQIKDATLGYGGGWEDQIEQDIADLQDKKANKVQNAVEDDLAALDANGDLVDSGKKLSDLQEKLTFDQTPTEGSTNPVTSGGVYDAIKADEDVIAAIQALIPAQATPENKLADKDFVNSSVATNTANYISNNGQPFTSVAQLEAYPGPVSNNDYAFVTGTDSSGNTYYDRYKATVVGQTVTWAKEYRLNNSSFTAEQWAAISSGITATLVTSYSNHLTNTSNPHQVSKAQVGLGNVDNTSDADKPVSTAQAAALALKADKVVSAVAGHLAGLDATGNLTDSGSKPSDFEPAAFGTVQNDPAQSVFDAVIAQAAAAPLLSAVIKGKTAAWNQLAPELTSANYTFGVSSITDGVATGTQTTAGFICGCPMSYLAHTYYAAASVKLTTGTTDVFLRANGQNRIATVASTNWQTLEAIFTASTSGTAIGVYDNRSSGYDAVSSKNYQLIDISLIFTSAELTAIGTSVDNLKAAWLKKFGYPLPQYIPYDAGSIVSNNAVYQLCGRNVWDEEWESGSINNNTGENIPSSERWRSKNYIKISPNTQYYCYRSGTQSKRVYALYYDENKVFLGTVFCEYITNSTFTTPTNASFMRFNIDGGNTKSVDVCINLSDASFNGTYEPYYNGGSIDCSAAPLNGVGTAQDEKDYATGERTTRCGVVDIGTLDWEYNAQTGYAPHMSCIGPADAKRPALNTDTANILTAIVPTLPAGTVRTDGTIGIGLATNGVLRIVTANMGTDPAAFKTAMSGVMLCYELATPTTTTETPQPLETQYGYNVLEPVSGGVQSGEVSATYVKTSGIATLINWIKAQLAAL